MLPGVELARRRRVHYHGDVTAGAGEHHHGHGHAHHQYHQGVQVGTGVVGPALAARNRLEEKLRGAAAPSSSPSRWGRRSHERVPSSQQQNDPQELLLPTEFKPPSTGTTTRTICHADQTRRTVSKAELCAVCLDEVRERHQRVTRLPCSHEYHSECVLPWLAIQPDCPCCRTLVPSVDALG